MARRVALLLVLGAVVRAGDAGALAATWTVGERHRVSYKLHGSFHLGFDTGGARDDIGADFHYEERFTESVVAVEGGLPTEVERTYVAYTERFPGTKRDANAAWDPRDRPLTLGVRKGALSASGKDRRGFPRTLTQRGAWCRWASLLHGKSRDEAEVWAYDKDTLEALLPAEVTKLLAKPTLSYGDWKEVEFEGRPAAEVTLIMTGADKIPKGRYALTGVGTLTFVLTGLKRVELKLSGQGMYSDGRNRWAGPWSLEISHTGSTPAAAPADTAK